VQVSLRIGRYCAVCQSHRRRSRLHLGSNNDIQRQRLGHEIVDRVQRLGGSVSKRPSPFLGPKRISRADPSFAGIIGLYDALYLPLKKGNNELLLLVTEMFGGWGFICRDGNAILRDPSMTQLWTAAVLSSSLNVLSMTPREAFSTSPTISTAGTNSSRKSASTARLSI